jgi:hypothetical protein
MLIIKLAVLTCLFYIIIAVLLEIAFILVSNFKDGIIMIRGGIGAWGILFGIVWAVSFSAAFYILHASLRAKLAH